MLVKFVLLVNPSESFSRTRVEHNWTHTHSSSTRQTCSLLRKCTIFKRSLCQFRHLIYTDMVCWVHYPSWCGPLRNVFLMFSCLGYYWTKGYVWVMQALHDVLTVTYNFYFEIWIPNVDICACWWMSEWVRIWSAPFQKTACAYLVPDPGFRGDLLFQNMRYFEHHHHP